MDRLRRVRGVVRSSITMTLANLDKLLQRSTPTTTNLQIQSDFLQRKAKELQELDKQIFDTVDDDGIEFKMLAAQEYEENFSVNISHNILRATRLPYLPLEASIHLRVYKVTRATPCHHRLYRSVVGCEEATDTQRC